MEWYPAVGFHFDVSIPGVDDIDTYFMEVSGLDMTLNTIPYQEGGSDHIYFLTNKTTFGNLVLKRGIYKQTSGLTAWLKDAFENYDIKPKDITISLLDEKHKPLASWDIVNAYPVKWSVSPFKADENSIVIETLELAFFSLKRKF
ncbi:MAG: phage tail protein [Bacteroidia bacterium]|nr:phage tail protein [Bacteroidia bacterium]